MISEIIKRFWRLLVVVGVTLSMRKKHSPNHAAATVGVWNAQASPSDVAAMTASYIFHMRMEIWYPLLWTVLALLMAAASSSVSIVLPPLLNIGSVAPVNPSAIFIPEVRAGNATFTALSYALQAPLALRAVGAADTIRSDAVIVKEIPAPGNTTSGDRGVRMDYHYKVNGTEFGFQYHPDLVFNVKGSCVTEYSWRVRNATILNNAGTVQSWTDIYVPWNNESLTRNASSLDNGPPFAFFVPNPYMKVEGLGNSTFAIIPSSLWRFSFTASEDPWYRTVTSRDEYPDQAQYDFLVRPNRPALSCWETAIWSYHNSRVDNLHLKDLEGLDLPAVFQDIVKVFLASPMITRLGIGLGRSSLASSIASVGATFYADRSTIRNDLTRLVYASYVATRNMMVDTTRFNNPGTDIKNMALVNNTNNPRPGVGDFVVSSPDIMSLSVRSLIVVPVVLAAIFLLTRVIALIPAPWRSTDALDARVLYSYVHEMTVRKSQEVEWKRRSPAAYNEQPGKTPMHPGYDKEKGVFWTGIDGREEAWYVLFSDFWVQKMLISTPISPKSHSMAKRKH